MKKILAIFLALFLVSILSQCTKEKAVETLPRDATSAEAQKFAQILSNNAIEKNARFTFYPIQRDKKATTGTGIIDWENSRVSLDITFRNTSSVGLQNIRNNDSMYETFPKLGDIESAQGLTPRPWVERPVSNKYGTDIISIYLLGLKAKAPDNPILVKQNGLKYLGQKKLNGKITSIFQQKEEFTYFIDEDNLLVRIDAQLPKFNGKLSFSFSGYSQQKVDLPDKGDIYPISEITSTYFDVRPNF